MTATPPAAAQTAAISALLDGFGQPLELPWPPSVNHYWLHTGRRVVLSSAATDFRRAALTALARQRVQLRPPWPFTGRVVVRIVLHPPSRTRRDVDNHAKAALDALTHAQVLSDDEQVDGLLIQRGNVVRGGCCFITIIPLPEVSNARK